MVEMREKPAHYNGSVLCDNCRARIREDKMQDEGYFHCAGCKYDRCKNCAMQPSKTNPRKQLMQKLYDGTFQQLYFDIKDIGLKTDNILFKNEEQKKLVN